ARLRKEAEPGRDLAAGELRPHPRSIEALRAALVARCRRRDRLGLHDDAAASMYHLAMRTAVTLDDDVYEPAQAHAQATGKRLGLPRRGAQDTGRGRGSARTSPTP